MPYERLGDALAKRLTPTVTTLPDGSIDRFCSIGSGSLDDIRTRSTLQEEIGHEGRSSFQIDVESTEPGGQAVNAADQLHALGGDVTCYGHLDDDLFASLPFETVSMGTPSIVYAFNFVDGDVMLAENRGIADWTLDDLRSVADLSDVFGVDAVCCGNWISVPGLEAAFHELGAATFPRVPFVLDPGDLLGAPDEGIDALQRALGALQDTFDVVLDANRTEIRAIASTLPGSYADDAARLAAIRGATDITAAVMHAPDVAAAATPDGDLRVPTLAVDEPARHTGGGDHFAGGLTYALAAGWDWRLALACGNVCASRFVETAATADIESLVDVARRAADDGA